MQIACFDTIEFAEVLDSATVLLTLETPGSGRTYVLECDGQDVIAVVDGITGDAVIIGSNDQSDDTSIHDEARRL